MAGKHCDNVKNVLQRTSLLHIRRPSIVRSIVLALAAFLLSLRLGGFPNIDDLHASRWQIVAVLAALGAMAETARCIQRKWTLYQAGVLILLYTDMMVLGLAVFLFFYP